MKKKAAAAAVIGVLASLATAVGTVSAEPSDQDETWMTGAHQSNLTEIAAGEAAVARSSNETVRSLGQMFIDMHTQLDAELTAAAEQLGVELPAEPTPSQQNGLAAVEAEQGAAFDAAWIANQIAGHRTSLEATRAELDAGSDPTVIALAEASAPVVEQHLMSLEQAAAASGAPTLVQTGSGGLLDGDGTAPWPLIAAGVGGVLLAAGIAMAAVRHRRA